MSASYHQIVTTAVASGALSIAGFLLLRKLMCCDGGRQRQVTAKQSDIYERDELCEQYLTFNYCSENETILSSNLSIEKFNVRNCFLFPKQIVYLLKDRCPHLFEPDPNNNNNNRRALDIGCAVGRTCFELSKFFDSVIGIDYSKKFIELSNKIKQDKFIEFESKLEGTVRQRITARLDRDMDPSKIQFEVGDACNLREDLGEFDLVLASNLVCRLVDPVKFLTRVSSLVKPKGYLFLSTPFTWSAEYTPQSNWLGGYEDEHGHEVDSFATLKQHLTKASFELKHQIDFPMFIRETKRKFQYTICLVSIWQKL